MKRILLTLALIATASFGALTAGAQTNAPAAASTNAPAAAAVASTNGPVAAWTTNAPTTEQRLESVEAYFQNGDPTATYKDTNGNWTVNFGLGASIINTNLNNSLAAYVS